MSILSDGFEAAVDELRHATDSAGSRLNLSFVGVSQHGERLSRSFPRDLAVDLRSISKPIVSLTLGALIDEQVEVDGEAVGLDSAVAPLLDRHFPSASARDNWSKVTVRHLLTNTIGHETGFLFRKDLGDLPESEYLEYALQQPISRPPGTHFSYSNVGPFLISVILQDHLEMSLRDLAHDRILGPLNIDRPWRNFGRYTAGCTGLMMTGEELLRVGELLLAGGAIDANRVVSTEWVRSATQVHAPSPGMFDAARVLPKFGYGLGFWVCEDGIYYCDGTDGQYLIVAPDHQLAIVTTGSQADMKPITRSLLPVLKAVGAR